MISDDKNQDLIEEKNNEDLLEEENQKNDENPEIIEAKTEAKKEEETLEKWIEGKSIIELSFKLFNLRLKKKTFNSKTKKEFKPHLIRLLKKRIAFLKKKSDSGSMRLKKFNRYRKNYL